MKKMTKGAIVTGLGVALLLGGGGTLAVWNTSADSSAGTIAAGDLDLKAGAGVWKNSKGQPVTITSYKVVPGETLTYTQDLDITLKGAELKAVLTTAGATPTNGFDVRDVKVSDPVLSTGSNVLTQTNDGQTATATTTFQFLDREGQARSSAGTSYDFGKVSYVLTQQAPSN